MSDTNIIFIYIPCRDEHQADEIGRAVVGQKMAACANIFPSIKSIYKWEGEVRSDSEAVLILKTTKDKFADVEAAVRALHSYQTPCIASLPVDDINEAYRGWMIAVMAAK